MAILWPKIASATLARGLGMVITWPFFIKIEWNKKLSSISLLHILVFGPHFCSKASQVTWAMLYLWTQNYPQIVGRFSGHHGQLISQNFVFPKIRLVDNVYFETWASKEGVGRHLPGYATDSVPIIIFISELFGDRRHLSTLERVQNQSIKLVSQFSGAPKYYTIYIIHS